MDTCTIVVAYGKNYVIGKEGRLPGWKLPKDMAHFRELTVGGTCIMGRKTYESFPKKFRPLPKRYNYILSRQGAHYTPEPTNFFTHVADSFHKLHNLWEFDGLTSTEKVFIIGGAEVYKEAFSSRNLWFVNEIIATEIEGEFEGDTFFPAPDYSLWNKEVLREEKKDEENSHDFTIVRYSRSIA